MEKGISDKFLVWAFTIGRAILIVVYTIALGAFLYRFGLDREIINLRDKIEQEQTIVSLSEANETKYRKLQEDLLFIQDQTILANDEIIIVDSIISLATGQVLFNTLDVTETTVQMEGSVRSISSLNAFLEELKELPRVKSVSLNKLESRVDQGIIAFSVNVAL